MEKDEAVFIEHVPCDACGSSDANSLYSNGNTYCFSCETFVKGDGNNEPTKRKTMANANLLTDKEYKALPTRKLTFDTVHKFGYFVTSHKGERVQVAPYYDAEGHEVGQKVRGKDKTFSVIGKISDSLFGQNLWQMGGRRVIVTEGEIDAMSVSQAQGNKWPVVSIPNGAQSAKKSIIQNLEWLEAFDEVVLMFDMDDPGRKAMEECAPLFTPGKAKVAKLPLKDAGEMLVAGRTEELINAIWKAVPYRPDGIVEVDDILEEALLPVERGLSWFLPKLDDATYGRRMGELVALGAGTGIGKTDFLTQQVAHDISLGEKPALFFLEQIPAETLARVAGKIAGRAFHIPGGDWEPEERRAAFTTLKGKMFMYDSFGANEWDVIKQKIRYLAMTEGTRVFYIDHLTALADASAERESLEGIMKELGSIVVELRIWVCIVSHLATPEGKSHEEGGRVTIRHFKGSRSIGFWCHFMLGMERNQQAADEKDRGRTILRVLKDRKTGRSTGLTIPLGYDRDTTRLFEAPPDDEDFEDVADGYVHGGNNKDF